jgi:alpha-beta hydrolase superfamily lysophospholipase
MDKRTSSFVSEFDGAEIATYCWNSAAEPLGVVQIAHGVAEHAGRYERLAVALAAAGYHVHAHDHRGHGASVSSAGELGSFGPGGWSALVGDLVALGQTIAGERPGLPLFLIGHSMGSFAAQEAVLDHSPQYSGLVLSASTALDLWTTRLAEADLGSGLNSFLNDGFEPRTGYEWLSRDDAEVDVYIADPLSGFDLAPATVSALFSSAERLADPRALAGIRSDLPILIASGDRDPAAGVGQLVEVLAQRYREASVKDVSVRLYPGARHEIFNETNRDEITADVVEWLRVRS